MCTLLFVFAKVANSYCFDGGTSFFFFFWHILFFCIDEPYLGISLFRLSVFFLVKQHVCTPSILSSSELRPCVTS